jgi:Ca-activated chloride channel family protein
MDIIAQFSHDRLDYAKDNTPHLVITLTAPQHDWVKKRPALCVIPLVDLSGSMKGPKLEYAKQSLHKLVDQLVPGDITGLIGFEARVHVPVEPGRVTPEFKIRMHKAIDALHDRGGTDLDAGILRALEMVNNLDLSASFLKRIIMFTDGQPNQGITDQTEILRRLTLNRGNITVSAFGYGNQSKDDLAGGCDQEFLQKFSAEGQGNYAFVKGPDDALTAFGRELGGLVSTYAQDLVIEIEPENGHALGKAVTDITVESNALGEAEFKIPEILAEETRHFVFETSLKKQGKVMPRAFNLFKVKVTYSYLTEYGKRETAVIETRAKATFVESGEEQKEPNKDLDEVIAMAQLLRAQKEAEELAKKGEFTTAGAVMNHFENELKRRGMTGKANMAKGIRSRLVSANAYSEGQGYLRSMHSAGTRAYGVSSMDDAARADLLSANVVLSNSSQRMVESTFTGRVSAPPVVHVPLVAPLPMNVKGTVIVSPPPLVMVPPSTDKSGT